jgi:hypothetical protein
VATTYEMTCSCGDSMRMDGESKEDAVDKLMSQVMTPAAVQQHVNDKHPGEQVPSTEQLRAALVGSAQPV